ncbi:MAG: amidohydrolase family protein [Gemmatimonadales bacterium]
MLSLLRLFDLRLAGVVLLFGAAGCAHTSPASPSRDGALLITGITIVDVAGSGSVRLNQTILVRGDRIAEVGDAGSVEVPSGVRVVDGRGKFAIPGLWDMHVHFMNTGPSALPLYIANGITSVREMGGYLDSTRAWQARMAAGTMTGPRFKTPGPILENPRYLAGVRERDKGLGGRLAPRVLPYRIGVADSADASRAVDSLRRLSVDFIKIRTVASPASYRAILSAAKQAGLTVAGHAPGVVSLAAASDAGQKSIEHGFYPPTSLLPDSARSDIHARFARNGTWYTPTLTVSRAVQVQPDSANELIWGPRATSLDPARQYASDWLLGWWRMQVDERERESDSARASNRRAYESSLADVREMSKAGVRILAGTDAGSVLVYPGFTLHEELRLLVEDAKLTPSQALWSATLGPALFFGMERDLGTIEQGRIADIVLLDSDPFSNIRNTRRISAVIQGGRLFNRAALDLLLEGVRREVSHNR